MWCVCGEAGEELPECIWEGKGVGMCTQVPLDRVTNPGVHQLQFALSPSLSLPDPSPQPQPRVGFDVLPAGGRYSSHRGS